MELRLHYRPPGRPSPRGPPEAGGWGPTPNPGTPWAGESGGERRRQGDLWAQQCQGAGWGSPLTGEGGIQAELGIHGNPRWKGMRSCP